jgi:hypothetical protein
VDREISVIEWGEITAGIKVIDEVMPIGGVFLTDAALFHPTSDFYSGEQLGPYPLEGYPQRLKQYILQTIAEYEIEVEDRQET